MKNVLYQPSLRKRKQHKILPMLRLNCPEQTESIMGNIKNRPPAEHAGDTY